MEAKKRKLSGTSSHLECCVCGESGSSGFTNIYNISLREKDELISFMEVVSFVLGIEVLQESSDICISCKPKIIEYYHFKKRSQSIQKKISPLMQETMKIVNNYITKNNIKAITIEESREKLVLMEKIPQQTSPESNMLDIEIKMEPSEPEPTSFEQNSPIEPNLMIKEEILQVDIKKELETDANDEDDNFQEPTTSQDIQTETLNDESKLDQILKLNQHILSIVSELDQKINEFKGKAHPSETIPYLLNQDAVRPQRK